MIITLTYKEIQDALTSVVEAKTNYQYSCSKGDFYFSVTSEGKNILVDDMQFSVELD